MSLLYSCSFRISPITWVLPANTGQILSQIYTKKLISQDCWRFSCVHPKHIIILLCYFDFILSMSNTDNICVKVQVLPGIPTKSARCFIDGISVNPRNSCIYWRNSNLEVSHFSQYTWVNSLFFCNTESKRGFRAGIPRAAAWFRVNFRDYQSSCISGVLSNSLAPGP